MNPLPIEDTLYLVPLENPTDLDTSLILTTTHNSTTQEFPLFTHICQVKDIIPTIIFDNGSQKNNVSSNLFQHLNLRTTPHPNPYHLGWVQQGGSHIQIINQCMVNFVIGPLKYVIICNIDPLDCTDFLLGLPH